MTAAALFWPVTQTTSNFWEAGVSNLITTMFVSFTRKFPPQSLPKQSTNYAVALTQWPLRFKDSNSCSEHHTSQNESFDCNFRSQIFHIHFHRNMGTSKKQEHSAVQTHAKPTIRLSYSVDVQTANDNNNCFQGRVGPTSHVMSHHK